MAAMLEPNSVGVAQLRSLQSAQEESLRRAGLIVKNCFVDEASPQGSRQRCLSAPPAQRGCAQQGAIGCAELDFGEVDSEDDVSTYATSSPGLVDGSLSSTGSQVGADEVNNAGRSGRFEAALGATQELQNTILTNCAFLRIEGCSYRPLPVAGKAGSQGTLMFFVAGLPWKKRARWLVPLRLTVSKVLEGCGYFTHMARGTLYVSDAEKSFKVILDFSPRFRPSE